MSLSDASAQNSDADSSGSDAAARRDGGSAYVGCVESAPRFRVKNDAPSGAGFSLLVHGLDVHVAYLSPTCIGVDKRGIAHGVRYARFATAGEPSEPSDVAYTDAAKCVRTLHPALAQQGDATLVSYAASVSGPYSVFARTLGGASESTLTGMRALPTVAALAAENIAGTAYTAWVEDGASASTIRIAPSQAAGDERVLVPEADGYHVTTLALHALPEGKADGARAVLAWASDNTGNRGIFLWPLDQALQPLGKTPYRLSDASPASPAISLDQRAVLYTSGSAERPDLRFRSLDAQGAPGDEARVTSSNERASVGSIASFAAGFVVAYRSVRGDDPTRALLRLSFFDPQGNLAGIRDLADTTADAGPIEVRTAVDGRIVLGFRERSEDGSAELNVVRVTCGS